MKRFLLISAIVALVITQQCVPIRPSVEVILSTDEYFEWSLAQNLFKGQNLTFTSNNPLSIQQVVNSLSPINHTSNLTNVTKLHAYTVSNGWSNSFSVLDGNWTAPRILRANGTYQQTGLTPNFTDIFEIYDGQNHNSTICFDFYEVKPGVYVVDCSNTKTNQFYVTSNPNTSIPNNNSYDSEVTTRILKGNTKTNSSSINITLFRGTPYYALAKELNNRSSIEIFTLNDTNMTPIASGDVLNSSVLKNLTSLQNIELQLVDFYVHNNGSLSVLDRSGAIYQVECNSSGGFLLNNFYHSPLTNQVAQALSVNYQLNSEGGYSLQYGVLFGDKFSVSTYTTDGQTTRIYQLPAPVTQQSLAQFQLSQNFIIVQDIVEKQLYVFEQSQNSLLYSIPNFNATSTINPYLGQIITVDNNRSVSHQISGGKVIFNRGQNSTTGINQAFINATSTINGTTVNCSMVLNYQITNHTSFEPVPKSGFYLPCSLPYPLNQPIVYDLDQLISGPAVTYQISNNNSQSTTEILQAFNMTLNNQSDYITKDLHDFVYLLSPVGSDQFYQFIQLSNKSLVIQVCVANNSPVPQNSAQCKEFNISSNIQAPTLTLQTFQAWMLSENLIFTFLNADQDIEFWACDDTTGCQGDKLPRNPTTEISGFTILAAYLYSVGKNQKVIDVYELQNNLSQVFQINQTVLNSQGYNGTFKPQNVFGNKEKNPSLLFVDNQDSLIILDYHSTLTLLAVIPYPNGGKTTSVQVGVAEQTFFLLTATNTAGSGLIQQYNYADLQNVYLMNNISLYGRYTFNAPIIGDFSSQSGQFFLLASDPTGVNASLLVLKPNVQFRDTLTQAISLKAYATNSMISVNGADSQYVYLRYGGENIFLQFLTTPRLVVSPKNYTDNLNINLQIGSSIDGKSYTKYNQSIAVRNTQRNVTIDKEQFKKDSNDLFKFPENSIKVELPLPFGFAQGPVINYTINCTDCNTKIFLQNIIEEAKILRTKIESITDFDAVPGSNNKSYAQTPTTITPVFGNLTLAGTPIQLELQTGMTCSLVAAQKDYIVSICTIGSVYYTHLTSCISGNCVAVGTSPLEGVRQTHKASLVGNSLLVLDSSQDPNDYEGRLLVYNLIDVAFKLSYTIDTVYLQSLVSVSVSDYFVAQQTILDTNSTVERLFLVDANGQFFILDCTQDSFKYLRVPAQATSLNLKDYLNSPEAQQYFGDDTRFLRGGAITEPVFDSETNQTLWKAIITTNNVAHYIFQVLYQEATALSVPIGLQVAAVLNKFSNLTALNRLQVNGDLVLVPHGNSTNIVYSIYNISQVLNSTKSNAAQVFDQISGTIVSATPSTQLNSFFYFLKDGQYPLLYLNNPANISEALRPYNVSSVKLIIPNTTNISSQKITLVAYNGYSSDTVDFDLVAQSDSSDSSGFAWYWILIIVVAGVIVVGTTVFLCLRRKNTDVNQERLLP